MEWLSSALEYLRGANLAATAFRLFLAMLFGGIIGLETALPLSITELVETGEMTLMSVLERLTTGPASLYHLQAGYVKEGGPADLVLFDPQKEYTIEEFVSKSKNSPFLGRKVRGEVYFTICAGKIVYEKTKE